MNSKKLERVIELGKRVEHFFIVLVGTDGFPYVNSARQIELVGDNQLAIEEWICPLTVKHIREHPKIAVLIWDAAGDQGYEILGEVLLYENQAVLDGFDPEAEERGYLPQVKRRLIMRAEKIAAFSHALRCDEIQCLTAPQSQTRLAAMDDTSSRVAVCNFAPEWAEHARFERDDEPCDDGRAGKVYDEAISECGR